MKVDGERPSFSFGKKDGESRPDRKAQFKNKHREDFEMRIGKKMHFLIAKIEQIHTRLDARIQAEASAGENVSVAMTALASSKASLEQAKVIEAKIQAELDAATDTTDIEALRATVKADFGTLKEYLKASHSSLVQVIIALKGLHLGAEIDHTTDASVGNQDN